MSTKNLFYLAIGVILISSFVPMITWMTSLNSELDSGTFEFNLGSQNGKINIHYSISRPNQDQISLLLWYDEALANPIEIDILRFAKETDSESKFIWNENIKIPSNGLLLKMGYNHNEDNYIILFLDVIPWEIMNDWVGGGKPPYHQSNLFTYHFNGNYLDLDISNFLFHAVIFSFLTIYLSLVLIFDTFNPIQLLTSRVKKRDLITFEQGFIFLIFLDLIITSIFLVISLFTEQLEPLVVMISILPSIVSILPLSLFLSSKHRLIKAESTEYGSIIIILLFLVTPLSIFNSMYSINSDFHFTIINVQLSLFGYWLLLLSGIFTIYFLSLKNNLITPLKKKGTLISIDWFEQIGELGMALLWEIFLVGLYFVSFGLF